MENGIMNEVIQKYAVKGRRGIYLITVKTPLCGIPDASPELLNMIFSHTGSRYSMRELPCDWVLADKHDGRIMAVFNDYSDAETARLDADDARDNRRILCAVESALCAEMDETGQRMSGKIACDSCQDQRSLVNSADACPGSMMAML